MPAAVTIVADHAELTPAWLTAALATSGVDAVVATVSARAVGTGQLGSCFRLHIGYERGEGPAHLIANLPATDPGVRAGAAMVYRTEVSFYRDLAPTLAIPVPRCYFAGISDDATTFTLMLEDLAPATAGDQIAGCTAGQARDAAVAIAALHAGSWCDATLDQNASLIPTMSSYAELAAPTIKEAAQAFLARRDLEPATTGVLLRFADGFVGWALDRPLPFALLHNDYRLDNLLFAPAASDLPPVSIVDWQSLSSGMPLRDVAFLVGTGLQQAERRTHERAIVTAYHEALLACGVTGYGAEECWEDYRYSLFHGLYICLMGEAVAAPTERGRQMFTVMAERAASAISDLDAFDLVEGA